MCFLSLEFNRIVVEQKWWLIVFVMKLYPRFVFLKFRRAKLIITLKNSIILKNNIFTANPQKISLSNNYYHFLANLKNVKSKISNQRLTQFQEMQTINKPNN
jgi:hypothetical protein